MLIDINVYPGGGWSVAMRPGRPWQKVRQPANQIAALKACGIDPVRFDSARAMTTIT